MYFIISISGHNENAQLFIITPARVQLCFWSSGIMKSEREHEQSSTKFESKNNQVRTIVTEFY